MARVKPIAYDETEVPAIVVMRLHDLRDADAAAIGTVRDRTARGQDVTREELQAARDALARDEVRAAGGLTAAVETLPPAPAPRRYPTVYDEAVASAGYTGPAPTLAEQQRTLARTRARFRGED